MPFHFSCLLACSPTGNRGDRIEHQIVVRESKRLSVFVFACLIALGLMLLGRDFFHPDQLFFKAVRDPNPWMISYPWREFIRSCFSRGEFPLWNPYNALGEPYLANYQPAIFSVLRWPWYFLPFGKVAGPFILLELVFAGFGTWLFLRRIRLSAGASFLGAAGFMLSGYLVQYLNNQHLVIDLLIPWGLLASERLAGKTTRQNFLLFILVMTLIILGGQPAAALFTSGFMFSYFACRAISLNKPKALAASIPALAAVLMISLPQVLPFAEAIPHSWTFHPAGTALQRLEVRTLSSLLQPGLPVFSGPAAIQQSFPWLGEVIVLFALVSIFSLFRLRREASFFGFLGLLGMGVVYGLPGFELLAGIPGVDRLSLFKYPQPVISFCFVVLAGFGFEKIFRSSARLPSAVWWNRSRRFLKWFFIFLALAGPVAWHRLLDKPDYWENLAEVQLGNFRKLVREKPYARFAAEGRVWIPIQNLMVPLYDLGINDALIPARYVKLVKHLNRSADDHEFMADFFAWHSLRLKESAFSENASRLLAAGYFIRKTPPATSRRGYLLDEYQRGSPRHSHTALFGDPIYVVPLPDPVPRVFFPQRVAAAFSAEDSFGKILQTADLEKDAVAEGFPGGWFMSPVEIKSFKPGLSSVSLSYRGGEAFAVMSEQYFPGWRAFVSGQETRIFCSDYLLRGVLLPAGEHELQMVYQPWGFRIGLYAGLSTLAVLLALGSFRSFSGARAKPER